MAFSDGQTHETVRQSPVNGKWLHIVSIPIEDESSAIVQVLESTTDITTRMETEAARDKALEELKEMTDTLEQENIYLRSEVRELGLFSSIVGKSNALLYVLSRVNDVAKTDATVLVQGETGVGKELISIAIQENSKRSKKPFIKINCAAIPVNLVESELFGYEPGAFTGAHKQHKGRFELADRGTIFLDEISETPLETQAKILRVLQDGKFERLGGTQTLKTDVRVIAATNRELNDEVTVGRFRADLYYRLNVYPITVPPLRKRRDDVPLLVEHFVPIIASRICKHIDQVPVQVKEQLKAINWPGKVRELKNVLERAIITAPDSVLRLPSDMGQKTEGLAKTTNSKENLSKLVDVERRHILAVLQATNWRISGVNGAARILGINPSTLRSRLKKLSIQRP
jgi:formate hydrogenlyase transcriptional activator